MQDFRLSQNEYKNCSLLPNVLIAAKKIQKSVLGVPRGYFTNRVRVF